MSEGAKVPVDDARRPAIPILMTLGALTVGAEVFDPARRVILMTEDKLPLPVTLLAKANGAPENLAVLSYSGCGNLPAARQLANMITELRSDCRIILHRDRDFRTDPEVKFELSTAEAERTLNAVTRVNEIFTPFNDVEHSFTRAAHLKTIFSELDPKEIEEAITKATQLKRDDLVNAAREARANLKGTLYDVLRKRKKAEWSTSGMPDTPPKEKAFTPKDGLTDVTFENSHGKILMDGLRLEIHRLVGGDSQDIERRIYQATDQLRTPEWSELFADQSQPN
jgi:hypothetical protein